MIQQFHFWIYIQKNRKQDSKRIAYERLLQPIHKSQEAEAGTSLVAQWLRLRTPNGGGLGSIPGQGTRSHMRAATKSSHAATKEPACCN